jgi:3'(2'), 5'-bisphosphate nucleotidase
MPKSPEWELLDGLTRIASRAAATILSIRREDLDRREKPDLSPVTAADEASEATILEGLSRLLPNVPVVSEEAAGHGRPAVAAKLFLVVDPLDGTREFLAGRDEYTVNIALVQDGTPVAGVIAAPARGLIWRGHIGIGAERLELSPGSAREEARDCVAIRTRARPTSGARVLVSRSHLDAATLAYVDRLREPERVSCGSALKFGLIAEGTADLYPRLAPTSAWDVAAGHAVLAAAGGGVQRPDGTALLYGQASGQESSQAGFLVPAFIAFGDRAAGAPR